MNLNNSDQDMPGHLSNRIKDHCKAIVIKKVWCWLLNKLGKKNF